MASSILQTCCCSYDCHNNHTMKVSRTTCLAALTAVGSASAFVSRHSGRSVNAHSRSFVGTTSTHMILERLFGGGGGAYEQKIAYDNLDAPGPELANWAEKGLMPATSEQFPNLELATFAGGCFWGLELAYQRVPGVEYTAVGYTQGPEESPTYGQVCSGATGHTEALVVYYNPKECTYETLLDTFFARVDPTTVNGQGNDFGRQYRTGVYTHSEEQAKLAQARFELEQGNYKKPIATELKAAMPFWPAEKYHQQYLEKGGRMGMPQDASKGATDPIRCYG